MSKDKRMGLILITVAGLFAMLGGMWFGSVWTGVAVAAFIVATGLAAGFVGEKLMQRSR